MTSIVMKSKIIVTEVLGRTSHKGLNGSKVDDVIEISYPLIVPEKHSYGNKVVNFVVHNLRTGDIGFISQTKLANTIEKCFKYEVLV